MKGAHEEPAYVKFQNVEFSFGRNRAFPVQYGVEHCAGTSRYYGQSHVGQKCVRVQLLRQDILLRRYYFVTLAVYRRFSHWRARDNRHLLENRCRADRCPSRKNVSRKGIKKYSNKPYARVISAIKRTRHTPYRCYRTSQTIPGSSSTVHTTRTNIKSLLFAVVGARVPGNT